jgi:UDP-glucose 4-epimerase
LLEAGHQVWVLDNLSRGHREAVPEDVLIPGDIRDVDHVTRVLRENRIEAVLHFAAFALVGESMQQPQLYYENNLRGGLALLQAMLQADVPKIVFSSTCAVYGVPTTIPIPEDSPTLPVNPYGRSKLAFEWALADLCRVGKLGYASLRLFQCRWGTSRRKHWRRSRAGDPSNSSGITNRAGPQGLRRNFWHRL